MDKVSNEIQQSFQRFLVGQDDSLDMRIHCCKILVGNSTVYKTNLGGRRIYIETREGWKETNWVVSMDGFTLGKDGKYHREPTPSSRSDEYIENTRFSSLSTAMEALRQHEKTNAGKEVLLTY